MGKIVRRRPENRKGKEIDNRFPQAIEGWGALGRKKYKARNNRKVWELKTRDSTLHLH